MSDFWTLLLLCSWLLEAFLPNLFRIFQQMPVFYRRNVALHFGIFLACNLVVPVMEAPTKRRSKRKYSRDPMAIEQL